ncbi:hypothetical protein [Bergeyella sp. RCAD1439]|uniref:hypothetical protein n=1 Tax=Bergeyella anatis TaxID=3113737 RepID=UPI002E170E3D|nr:hypothetical protein [Bergeyella sp. RCAD1439]
MKPLKLLLLFIFLMGCSQKARTQNNGEPNTGVENRYRSYGEKLIAKGFLKYADHSKIENLKFQLLNNFAIYEDDYFKMVSIDAEELAEFNFDFFLPQLNKLLEKRKIGLTVKLAEDYEKTNDLIINGERFNLYTKEEFENRVFWDSAARNFFRKINEILKNQNLDERFYLLYGGNDLQAMLLTDEQFSIIAEYYNTNEKERPYAP